MEDIFIRILNMSITASYFAAALIIIRALFRKMPKWLSCILWGLVGLRLILPFSFESILSLIPSAETVPSDIMQSQNPHITSGISALNSSLNPIINEAFAPTPHESVNPLQVILFIVSVLWVAGIISMLLYALISYILLRRKTDVSFETEKGVFICDSIDSPFILGVFKPGIFVPSFIGEEDKAFILAHEKAHIKRKDHLWKPLGFIILAVHWFNPVMWAAYILLCRDIEGACDEKVIKEMEAHNKKAYSEALINCSAPKKYITACPLAFGETGVKQRIKNVLKYKKPAFWVVIITLVLSIILSLFFLTDPVSARINDIEGCENIFSSVEKLQFFVGEAFVYTTEDPADELREIKKAKIENIPVSEDRSEDRDKSYKIEINDSITINIDETFSVLWIDDGVKPTLSYKIKNPEVLKNIFSASYIADKTTGEPTVQAPVITSSAHSEFDGVYLTVKSIDQNHGGHYVFNIIWNNLTDKEVLYGANYDIEYKNGDTWKSVAEETITFPSIGYTLKADSTEHKKYTTQWFDISKTGEYRLITDFSVDDGNSYKTYIEFQINDAGGNISDIGGVSGPIAVITTIENHKDNPVIKNVPFNYITSPVEYNKDIYSKIIEIGGIPSKISLSSINVLPKVKITSLRELENFIEKNEGCDRSFKICSVIYGICNGVH